METKTQQSFPQYFYMLLAITIAASILVIVAITNNNSLRSAPIFLALFAIGMGISSGRGLVRGGLLGLLILSAWIIAKQTIGVWSKDTLIQNLVEVLFATIAFVASGIYHEKLRAHFREYRDTQRKLKVLDLEDTAIGLIKPGIGLLRLKEETDRALRYRRPFSLVLVYVHPIQGTSWEMQQRLAILRAIATTIKDTTRAMDIPFLLDMEKIALILPDTQISGAQKVLNNIQNKMSLTRIITPTGDSESIKDYALVRYGFGTFLGRCDQIVDMMAAANRSLDRNLEMNIGNIFQNLFIDWETIGEMPVSQTVIALERQGVFETTEQTSNKAISPLIGNNSQIKP